jgi:16S rRNA (uracil1498-N3)-methyltransferase
MTRPVFLVPPGTTLTVGGTVRLTGAEGHHAAKAQRLRVGEPLDLVDGAGSRGTGVVAGIEDAEVVVKLTAAAQEPPPRLLLHLVQGLAKHRRDESAIEAATELGVDRITPWQSDRAVVTWEGAKAAKGQERWRGIALAAAKVARRSYLPVVDPVVTTPELVRTLGRRQVGPQANSPTKSLSNAPANHVVVLHEAAERPLTAWMAALPAALAGRVTLVVGPEGGIADAELAGLTSLPGAVAVRLGANVLRSSTAGPAAIAALSAHLGRWD